MIGPTGWLAAVDIEGLAKTLAPYRLGTAQCPTFPSRKLAMLGNPFFGKMSDRTSSQLGMRRPCMVIGLVGGSLGILMVALAPQHSGGSRRMMHRPAALQRTARRPGGRGAAGRAAATVTTAVAVLFAPPILGALVSNEIVATVGDHLPAGLSAVLVSGTGERYGPEVVAALLLAWTVGTLAIGVIILHGRDPRR
jgi:MFS family permease